MTIKDFKNEHLNTPYTKKGEPEIWKRLDQKHLYFVIGNKAKEFRYKGRIRNTKGMHKSKNFILGYYDTLMSKPGAKLLTVYDAKKKALAITEGQEEVDGEEKFYDSEVFEENSFVLCIEKFIKNKRIKKKVKKLDDVIYYSNQLKNYTLDYFSNTQNNKNKPVGVLVNEITPKIWLEIQENYSKAKLSENKDSFAESTQNNFYSNAHSFFNFCYEKNAINSNPIRATRPFKRRRSQEWFTRDEIIKIIKACQELKFPYSYLPQLHLLLVRHQETLLSMEWKDIKWKEKIFRSSDEIEKSDGVNLDVPLSDKALELLEEMKKKQEELGINSNYLFANPDKPSEIINIKNQRKSFQNKIKALTGIKNYNAKTLRHSSRTHLSRLKTRPECVSFIGGWSQYGKADEGMNYNHDDYSFDGEAHQAVNKLAELFYGSVPTQSEEELKEEGEEVSQWLEKENISIDPKLLESKKDKVFIEGENFALSKFLLNYSPFQDFVLSLQKYQWTQDKEDLKLCSQYLDGNLRSLIRSSVFTSNLEEKYLSACEEAPKRNKRRSELREFLPQISSFLFLEKAIKDHPNESLRPRFRAEKEELEEFIKIQIANNLSERIDKEFVDIEHVQGDNLDSIKRRFLRYKRRLIEINSELGFQVYEHKGARIIVNVTHISEEAVAIAREYRRTLVLRNPTENRPS